MDTRSPATRATLAATPVADLVASPLAPLAFDLKKLASQAPARAKDGAIVALSAQLDAMRARLREAEQAAGSPRPSPPRPRARTSTMQHKRTGPPRPRRPSLGEALGRPPRREAPRDKKTAEGEARRRAGVVVAEPGPGSGAPFSGYDRAHGVALLRLESEAREWRERLETAERRERDAREETSAAAASARARGRSRRARPTPRQLEVLKYRSLARGTTKLLERRARRAMAAFRLCVRAASRERRVERELVPKWNRVIRKRLAFKRFAGAAESRRKARVAGERVALAAILRFARRVTRARGSRRRARAARSGGARRARRRRSRRGGRGGASAKPSTARGRRRRRRRATARRRASILYARNERRRHFALPFAAWRHETIRESEAEAHAAELVARATSTRVYRFAGGRVRRRKIILLHAWRATARERLRLRVAVARARGRWQAARGAQLVRAWHVAKRASKHAKRVLFSRAFGAWEASARERRFAETLAARGARNRARRAFSAAFVAWARLAAPRMVANAEARVVAAEAKAAEARSLADRADRAAASDREALASAAARTESLAGSLASAERRARALAPTGGGLLETPLGWRGVQTANASVVAEMGTSAHLGGAKRRAAARRRRTRMRKVSAFRNRWTRGPRVHPRPRPVRAGRV